MRGWGQEGAETRLESLSQQVSTERLQWARRIGVQPQETDPVLVLAELPAFWEASNVTLGSWAVSLRVW